MHAVSTARRGGRTERERERGRTKAQQTAREEGGEGKKIHTRPVMQKHRFNVRLGSVISGGERKKLGWTRREEEQDGDLMWRKRRRIHRPEEGCRLSC